MSESKGNDEDKELSEGSSFGAEHKRSGKEKDHDRLNDKDDSESNESSPSDEEDDDREASFFSRSRRRSKTSSEETSEQDERNRLLDGPELDSQAEKNEAKSLTEAEAKEAVSAIADGLSRELRNEFDQSTEASIAELETVAVAAFVDSLREKLETGDRDITEELLDEALGEALEDLLVVDEGGTDTVDHDEAESGDGDGNNGSGNNGNNGSNSNGNGGDDDSDDQSQSTNLQSNGYIAPPVAALIAANADVDDALAGGRGKRGKGLLIGGVVGYIIGRRHGNKRTEAKLRSEIDQLEDQIAELYEALAAREHVMRQVVRELAARQLGEQHTAKLAALQTDTVSTPSQDRPDASKEIKPPSLVVPAVFATLLVSARLMADVSDERYTWGKDVLVGGTAGYMVGRRHGRKRTETRLKSEMEQLEDQVSSLQGDLVSRDSVIDAMVRVADEADREVADQVDGAAGDDGSVSINARNRGGKELGQANPNQGKPTSAEKQLVDASIDRIAAARKNRELKRHKKHLLETGKAAAVGEFNLASSVFLERRLMDGTENSSERKQIEVMNEGELLAMAQNMYVDGESAIALYDKGRVELEVLRESVIQYWRKTGNYEQTLRTNLKADESAINDIRTNLERAYRSILENAQ